jgi:hypothetical protein
VRRSSPQRASARRPPPPGRRRQKRRPRPDDSDEEDSSDGGSSGGSSGGGGGDEDGSDDDSRAGFSRPPPPRSGARGAAATGRPALLAEDTRSADASEDEWGPEALVQAARGAQLPAPREPQAPRPTTRLGVMASWLGLTPARGAARAQPQVQAPSQVQEQAQAQAQTQAQAQMQMRAQAQALPSQLVDAPAAARALLADGFDGGVPLATAGPPTAAGALALLPRFETSQQRRGLPVQVLSPQRPAQRQAPSLASQLAQQQARQQLDVARTAQVQAQAQALQAQLHSQSYAATTFSAQSSVAPLTSAGSATPGGFIARHSGGAPPHLRGMRAAPPLRIS